MTDAQWKLAVDEQGVTIAGDHFQLTTGEPGGAPQQPTVDEMLYGSARPGRMESVLSELEAMTRLSYGQYCGLARAAEVLGERWSVLILRDLAVGPKRAEELRAGLPLVPVEILAMRLRDLERTGVITNTAEHYRLTGYGVELSDVLLRMSRWGARMLGQQRPEEIVTTDSLVFAMLSVFRPERAGAVRAGYELRVNDKIRFHVVVENGTVYAAPGGIDNPDLILEPGDFLTGLMDGTVDPFESIEDGRIRVTGDPALLVAFTEMFRIPEPVTRSAAD